MRSACSGRRCLCRCAARVLGLHGVRADGQSACSDCPVPPLPTSMPDHHSPREPGSLCGPRARAARCLCRWSVRLLGLPNATPPTCRLCCHTHVALVRSLGPPFSIPRFASRPYARLTRSSPPACSSAPRYTSSGHVGLGRELPATARPSPWRGDGRSARSGYDPAVGMARALPPRPPCGRTGLGSGRT